MTYYGGTKIDGPFFYCRLCDLVLFIYPSQEEHSSILRAKS